MDMKFSVDLCIVWISNNVLNNPWVYLGRNGNKVNKVLKQTLIIYIVLFYKYSSLHFP